MSSQHLQGKLKEALGDAAGEEAAALIDRIDPIRGDIAELRHAIDGKLEQAFEKHLKPVHARLDELTKEVHAVDKRIETVKGDVIAWSFVFWVGAVAAVAVLAAVLRP